MPGNINKYGLSRNIPKAVARAVRRRCGFGCVICGKAIYTYEHFDPIFSEAKAHNSSGITLLCGNHQTESYKGILSKDTIKQANADPICKQSGFANYVFDLGGICPRIVLGTNQFEDCKDVITVGDKILLGVKPPALNSNFWRLSGEFGSAETNDVCSIFENELSISANVYDFQQVGRRFTIIESAKGDVLDFEIDPPRTFLIKRCVIKRDKSVFTIADGTVRIDTPTNKNISFTNSQFISMSHGFKINADGSIKI